MFESAFWVIVALMMIVAYAALLAAATVIVLGIILATRALAAVVTRAIGRGVHRGDR